MRLRIFVVDDEESIRDTFKQHLESRGHEVITAVEPLVCDIYHGCDCTEPFPCADVVFVDYLMPRMNGLEFLERLAKRGCKGDPGNKYIMSGNATGVDMERVKEVGCIVLQKPVTLEDIDRIIEEAKQRIDSNRKLNDIERIMERAAIYIKTEE